MTSFQVKVLQKKFTLLHAHFSKIVLNYSNEVHLLRYLTPLNIGTYGKICVICPSYFKHSFSWTTGPLSNRLPILNLMIASSIVCTGMEYSKVIRVMEPLNILCIKQREFSNLQSAYVIPAVFNVWKKEQLVLLDYIKDKSI